MKSKIIIIEDEKPNADRLQRLIKSIRPNVEILAVLESIAESLEWFSKNETPDLAIMDVRLSDGLSFEILSKTKLKCPVIFTTAYDEYAVRAFKFNSLDYLLKPVELEELENAFLKLEEMPADNFEKKLESLLNFVTNKEYRTRFLLPFRDGFKILMVSDVEFFHSEMKITRAKLLNGTEEVVLQTMEELEAQLDPKLFFRANRQFIIHIDSVESVYNYFNSKLKIVLKKSPDIEIIISREKAGILKSWIDF